MLQACSIPEVVKETLLFDFEDESELNRIEFKCKTRFKLSSLYKKHGNSSLEIKFYPADLVGFIINDIQYGITGKEDLSFWVFNPSITESILFIKVGTTNTSEYGQTHVLKQGKTMIHIPCNKLLQKHLSSEIRSISIYRKNIEHIEILYFDFFRLI